MRMGMDLCDRSDQDLLSDVAKLVGAQRTLTAKLVACLAEVEERRLHLLAGFSSMFELCMQKLGMSEGEAYRRILAARLSRRFPVVISLLASGSVHLSTLELARDWLTEDNHEELFAAVAGKSKREVQAFLAARFPRPDKPSSIERRATIEPLSEARFRVEFTASDALRRKLELCRDLMSHANPSRDLAVVIERAVDLLLVELERKRLGRARRPRRHENGVGEENATHARVQPPRVTTAVRREVFERDGLRCTYVAENGRRCEARALLELDHVHPKALGGGDEAANLRVRCQAHNQLWAEQTFGRAKVERLRQKKCARERASDGHQQHFRQQKCSPERLEKREARERPRTVFEKVHLALRVMGFREAQARRAIAEVERKHSAGEELALEQTLREALHVATAA